MLTNKHISPTRISSIVILTWLAYTVIESLRQSVNIPTGHLDGAFQTASSLFRLDMGLYPGRDFFPYLGIGPNYLIYPFYKLFGSNLASSVTAAYFIVSVTAMISNAFIFHMVWKSKSFIYSLAASCVFLYILLLIYKLTYFRFLGWSFEPGNSLKPVRAFISYIAAIVIYFFINKLGNKFFKILAVGTLTSFVLMWSNDFAYTTALLLCASVFLYLLLQNKFDLKSLFLYSIISLICWFCLIFFACSGHPFEMLKYNFVDVAKDQWWYFAPYSEPSRIFSLTDLLKLSLEVNLFGLIAFIFLLINIIKYKSIELFLIMWIGIALFFGGWIATVGGHVDSDYFLAYKHWLFVIYLSGGARLTYCAVSKHFSYQPSVITSSALLIGFIVVAILPFTVNAYKYRTDLLVAENNSINFFVTELGGYLSRDWFDYIQLARTIPRNIIVVEEYWGIWSAVRRTFSNLPVDSVIHALGSIREISKDGIQNADMVITTRPNSYPLASKWQPWSISSNYWFYQILFKSYDYISASPKTFIWKKSNFIPVDKTIPCFVLRENNKTYLNILDSFPGFYEVNINYKDALGRRHLIMMQNNINYAMDSNGFISINPNLESTIFPAYINSVERSRLIFQIIGDPDFTVLVRSCTAKKLTKYNEEFLTTNRFK